MSAAPVPAGSAPGLLAHRLSGRGEALLLLNGGLMSLAAWEPLCGRLEASLTVVRCDLRGQLLSPGTPHLTLDGHVADLVALLDALALPRAHVAGTSFGAEVGLLLAAVHPERVASLAAVTATERIEPAAWEQARPLLEACRAAAQGGDGGAVLDLLLPSTFSPRYLTSQAAALAERRRQIAALPRAWFAGLAGLLGSLQGLDLRPFLGRIRCPALVVAAAQDATFPLERSRALAEAIPGASLVVVEEAGHALVAEAPERLADILLSFLARVGRGGGAT